jgi:hypothetical protein
VQATAGTAGRGAGHGEALMRRRKAWYHKREPRPGVSVIGDRLMELASGGRRWSASTAPHGGGGRNMLDSPVAET